MLRIKADEFALKARLKATDYADSLRYDSAVIYFEQSRKYSETVENLWDFAYLLGQDNQVNRAIDYYERALSLSGSERVIASLSMNLGNMYYAINKMPEAEKMYLRSLKIRERLAKSKNLRFESDLARVLNNLGNFYYAENKLTESESMYEKSLGITERLEKTIQRSSNQIWQWL